MKKLMALLLVAAFCCAFCSCGKESGEYRLSVGVALSEDIEGLSLTGTSAAVVTDREGRVVLCRLDSAEVDASLTDKGIVGKVAEKTKVELGDAYGMVEKGGAISEWYKQSEFFEKYVVGKTIVEIEKIKTGDAELVSGCTIDVTDFIRAISAAIKSDKRVEFDAEGDMSAGLSIVFSSTADKDGNAEFLYDTAAVAVSGGKVVASFIDSAEATVTLKDGKGYTFVYSGTKNELGAKYGMVEKGGAISEWFEQARSYGSSAVGKSPDELSSLATENVSGCTIDAEPLKAALLRAAKNLR